MAEPLEIVDFHIGSYDRVLRAVAGRVKAEQGWVNLLPIVDDPDSVPKPSMFMSIFGAKGTYVPLCTWTAGSVGVQHAQGTKAGRVLAEAGVELPPGWRPIQDSPRRGLVIELPDDADPAAVVDFLVRAGEALAMIETTGDWRAIIYG